METFIVRIYRRNDKEPEILIGDVEKAGSDERQIFHDFTHLRKILTARDKSKRARKYSKPGEKDHKNRS